MVLASWTWFNFEGRVEHFQKVKQLWGMSWTFPKSQTTLSSFSHHYEFNDNYPWGPSAPSWSSQFWGGGPPRTTTATLEISSVHMNVRSSLLPSSRRKSRWGRSRSWATRISSPLECGRLVRDSASVPRQPPGSHNRFVCSHEIAWMFNVIGIF